MTTARQRLWQARWEAKHMGPTERIEEAAIERSCSPELNHDAWELDPDDYLYDVPHVSSGSPEAFYDDLEHDYVQESETERYWREQNEERGV